MTQEHVVFIFIGLFALPVIVFVFLVIATTITKRSRQQKTQQEYAERYRKKNEEAQSAKSKQVGLTDEQRTRLDTLREYYKERIASDGRDKHQVDADEHEHVGEEEHYEEIVGSLGEVNDEGCVDLSGVRFIAHDLAYEVHDNNQADYVKIAQTMVMGDILNNPRFKKPYSRK